MRLRESVRTPLIAAPLAILGDLVECCELAENAESCNSQLEVVMAVIKHADSRTDFFSYCPAQHELGS